jgi:hypothetical protein
MLDCESFFAKAAYQVVGNVRLVFHDEEPDAHVILNQQPVSPLVLVDPSIAPFVIGFS